MHEEWTDKLSEYLDDELPAGERAALERHLAGCASCLAVLNDLAKSLITTKDLDEVLRRVVNAARELIKAEASVLWLFEAGVLWPVAWEGIEDRAAEPLRFQVTPNLAERLADVFRFGYPIHL